MKREPPHLLWMRGSLIDGTNDYFDGSFAY